MRLPIAIILLLFFTQCSSSRHAIAPDLPFAGVKFTLVSGKLHDSTIRFSTAPEQSFVVHFSEKNFRSFDGSFSIRGTAKDTDSVYYTGYTTMTGFFYKEGGSVISMQWFKNISWSFHFEKYPTRRAIAGIFSNKAIYEYDGSKLLFFTNNGNL